MTPAQRQRFYFPAWRACAQSLGWTMAAGRLVADLAGQRAEPISSPAREERIRVIDLAEALAEREHRAVIADDLRHACNHIASGGRTTSTGDMDSPSTTIAVRLFSLLADPDDFVVVGAWMDPEEAARKEYVSWLARLAPEATLNAISLNAWGTSDWETKDMPRLRWLARTVKEKQFRRRSVDPDNVPF